MKNHFTLIKKIFATFCLLCTVPTVSEAIVHNTTVTPNVIFGSGVTNGGFSVETSGNIEIGLRAKTRFDNSSPTPMPLNDFPNDGAGNFNFVASDGNPPPGLAMWNFEWSINSDTGDESEKLNDYTYELLVDIDPTAAVSLQAVQAGGEFFPDIINLSSADHAFGNNSTVNGGGTSLAIFDPTAYANLIDSNNVAQNSWNYGFFENTDHLLGNGEFRIELAVFDGGSELARTAINVTVVPEPSTYALLGGTLGLVGMHRRRIAA